LGPVNDGIWTIEASTGQGWILHSVESLFDRFSENPLEAGNSQHMAAVRFNSDSDNWEYTDNFNWFTFQPTQSDVLLAEVDYGLNTIDSLQGENEIIHGIQAGYISGDLEFLADVMGDNVDIDEFRVIGNNFEAYDYEQAISIAFSDLMFANADNPRDVNDSFEIAVVDQDGNSLLPTLSPHSNAVFNISQGQPAYWATGVVLLDQNGIVITPGSVATMDVVSGTINLNVSGLDQGTVVTVLARLINNDADDTTQVTVDFQSQNPNQGQLSLGGIGAPNSIELVSRAVSGTTDFSLLSDVTQEFDVNFGVSTADNVSPADGGTVAFSVDIDKQTNASIRHQLILAFPGLVDQLSRITGAIEMIDFNGTIPLDIDGVPAGTPFVSLSNLYEKDQSGFFRSDTSLENVLLQFKNIFDNDRFDFDFVLLGQRNRGPAFTSDPYQENRGQAYPVDFGTATETKILEIVANGSNSL
jgi:hypothetical protein